MKPTIPVSFVVPTKDRPAAFARMLKSLFEQSHLPAELIVVDSSQSDETEVLIRKCSGENPQTTIKWVRAQQAGAAVQRNQGVSVARETFIGFCDDDVLFEAECVGRLWRAIQSDDKLGGVNAMIVNQKYAPPGAVSRFMFRVLSGKRASSYAGRVIGPAINLLPEDREDLPEVVPVEWLNLGCTIYRREALPSPPFDSVFTGYSMMEDLTLSLRVGKNWKLANARTARIFHDSQPGSHKSDVGEIARMELINRHYVMTEILGRKRVMDVFRLYLWEMFQLVVCVVRAQSRPNFLKIWRGRRAALRDIHSK